jgi:hypothetical protein
MNAGIDRRRLLATSRFNGIDYVEFSRGRLEVHFQTREPVAHLRQARVTGGWPSATARVLPVRRVEWSKDEEGRPVLSVPIEAPGDSSTYRLDLESPSLDPYFAHATFSFETETPRTVDCERPSYVRATSDGSPTIDYLAKDFTSFRQVLSDFSAQRYPAWRERSEADFGVMFMEALCSLADDLSYQQDRIAAEAYIDTATQRLSVTRQARLVDYWPAPATAARTWLQFGVTAPTEIPAGLKVTGHTPDGTEIVFETVVASDDVDPSLNELTAYLWDESDRWLRAGATSMWVDGSAAALRPGMLVLVDTPSPGSALRQSVRLTDVVREKDPIRGHDVTRLVWSHDEALTDDRDLSATVVRGNLVPAIEGQTYTEAFAIGAPSTGLPQATVRTGPNGTPQYLYTPQNQPIARRAAGAEGGEDPGIPEIAMVRREDSSEWQWAPWLLDAQSGDTAFTLDPGTYLQVGAALPDGSVPMDYAGDPGETIRFGDGTYGAMPESPSTFDLQYRVGGGAAGNVAADVLTSIDLSSPVAAMVLSVTNPFPAAGGADAEGLDTIRQLAPDAIAASQLRAVTRADYEQTAESLPWVTEAQTRVRYVGSWLCNLTHVAAGDGELPSRARLRELDALFERRRMAGRESIVLPPRYVSLDLDVTVRAKRHASRQVVKTALAQALSALSVPGAVPGFFRAGQYGFGQSLVRADLETAIRAVPGVDWIVHLLFRRRGGTAGYSELPEQLIAAEDEIIRVDGDPQRPDAGSVRVDVQGGQ